MATYSNVPAVSGAIAVNGTSGTLYTCPANSYAIINAAAISDGLNNNQLTVGGKVVAYMDGTGGSTSVHSSSGVACTTNSYMSFGPIYVGPSQAVAVSGGADWNISGVCLTNQA